MLSRAVVWDILRVGAPRAKNVIMFIGDGMGYPMITGTRILSRGLAEGRYNSFLETDRMDFRGTVTTSGYDALVTDSSNSASAYATGHKSVNGAMGVYKANTTEHDKQPQVENILELAKRTRNMTTGFVTTADNTDATPAAFAAHTLQRDQYAFIAAAYLHFAHRPDVLMGEDPAGSRRTPGREKA